MFTTSDRSQPADLPAAESPIHSTGASRTSRASWLAAALLVVAASAGARAQCDMPLIGSNDAGTGNGYVLAMDGARAVGGTVAGLFDVNTLHFDGTSWLVDGTLLGSDTASGDHFGTAVAISGNRILVGAEYQDSAGTDAGAAYVFEYDGLQWVERAKLVAADGAAYDYFGTSVAISGNTAMVGAPGADGLFGGSGAVYVFHYSGGVWWQVDKLLPYDPVPNGGFATSLALRSDRAVVGQFAAHAFTGAADVYESIAGTWSWTAHLTASDAAVDDEFGDSVAIDGDHIVIAARQKNAVYFFDRGPAGWTQSGNFVPNGKRIESVSVCGERALVGAPGLPQDGDGVVLLYACHSGSWSEVTSLSHPGGFMSLFGKAVALSGAQAMIGMSGTPQLQWFDATCEPWTSNGGARHSVLGKLPVLSGSGPLVADSPNSVMLSSAAPAAPVALFLGAGPPGAVPFAGSFLQVDPVAAILILGTNSAGTLNVQARLPAGLAGILLVCQCIVADPTADYGFALSNGLLIEPQ